MLAVPATGAPWPMRVSPSTRVCTGRWSSPDTSGTCPACLTAFLRGTRALDGFFFTTHILALEAFRYFHDRGIDINDGYGLACIHEVPFMSVLAPACHVARMPVGRIGRESVRMLLEDMRRRKSAGEVPPAETVELECELCFRG